MGAAVPFRYHPSRSTGGLMLRYRRISDEGTSYHGVYADQFGNHYVRTLVWHPAFWWFIATEGKLKGKRWKALGHYIRTRRQYIGGDTRHDTCRKEVERADTA
jgi:hypothetical protein